jgi:hypothetical protein
MGMKSQQANNKRTLSDRLGQPLFEIEPSLLLTAGSILSLGFAAFGSVPIQIVFLSLVVVAMATRLLVMWRGVASLSSYDDLLSAPIVIAQDREILERYRSLSTALRAMSAKLDPIHRDLALERLGQLDREVGNLARGQIVFTDTESWRTAYGRLLRGPGIHRYRSVAYAKTLDYWQNEPGHKSMQVNFDVQNGCTQIERIVIIPDTYWPANELVPMEPLNAWIDEQHQHGITIRLVRLSSLNSEPDLVADMGIYGNRAVGYQEINEQGLTTRFRLLFDFAEVLAAELRWDRLAVYATPY